MAWVKIDDRFFLNPKVMQAGLEGRALYLSGLCYCAGELTDGAIAAAVIYKLAVLADIADPEAAVARLVDLGLWEATDTGYQVHDYLHYNPSREQVQRTREARAEAGSRGGKQKSSNLLGAGYTSATDMSLANRYPVPDPLPQPNQQEGIPPTGGTRAREARPRDVTPAREEPAKAPAYPAAFAAFWRAYPRPNGRAWDKPAALKAWQALRPDGDLADAICAGVAAWRLGRDWQREFIKSPANFLAGRLWEEPPEPWDQRAEASHPARASPRPRGTQEILAEAFGGNGHDPGDPDRDHHPAVYDVALSRKDDRGRAGVDRALLVRPERPDG